MASQKFKLNPGDRIAIVAPGSSAPIENLNSGLAVLKKWGFEPYISGQIMADNASPFYANTDKLRFQSLKKALFDPKTKAIWCLRGGYGSIRLVPELIKLRPPKVKKMMIGYSDITTLQTWLYQNWKWPSVHGPLIDRLESLIGADETAIKSILDNKWDQLSATVIPINTKAKKIKSLVGVLTGGNLNVIQSTLGTPVHYKGSDFVFLEDCNERGYRIDRMLVQMHQAGCFKKTKAIFLGAFIGGDEKDGKNYVQNAIIDFANHIRIPVYSGVPAGHGNDKWPMIFGHKYQLAQDKNNWRLQCLPQ